MWRKVQQGHATRFGAVTRNGEGEVVAGIAIMLKGENQEVIRNVKLRIERIQKSLPGRGYQNFIDRTNLVDRGGTIARNLIEGGLHRHLRAGYFPGQLASRTGCGECHSLACMFFAFGMMKTLNRRQSDVAPEPSISV